MKATSRPDFALVWQRGADGRRRLGELLEIYSTALGELRAMGGAKSAGLIATFESLYAAATREKRYLDAAEHAAGKLTQTGSSNAEHAGGRDG